MLHTTCSRHASSRHSLQPTPPPPFPRRCSPMGIFFRRSTQEYPVWKLDQKPPLGNIPHRGEDGRDRATGREGGGGERETKFRGKEEYLLLGGKRGWGRGYWRQLFQLILCSYRGYGGGGGKMARLTARMVTALALALPPLTASWSSDS